MINGNQTELIKTTIKEREVIYYLTSEGDLNDIGSKRVLCDLFMLLFSIALGGFISVILAKATSMELKPEVLKVLDILWYVFLIAGIIFLILTIYFYSQGVMVINNIKASGKLKSLSKVGTEEKGFKVIKAIYMSIKDNNKYFDVTKELIAYVIDGKLSYPKLVYNTLKGDPHENELKKLIITYSINGEIITKEFKENDPIELP